MPVSTGRADTEGLRHGGHSASEAASRCHRDGLTLWRRFTVAVANSTSRKGILMPTHHDTTRRVCPSSAGAIEFTHTISGKAERIELSSIIRYCRNRRPDHLNFPPAFGLIAHEEEGHAKEPVRGHGAPDVN